MAGEMVYGMGRRSPTYRSLDSLSPRFFCEAELDDEPHHFLDRCFLCKKHLGGNSDIFMYRGNTPFCSEECREEQIEIDEANERNWGSYASKQKQRKGKAAASEIRVRATGTVVAG